MYNNNNPYQPYNMSTYNNRPVYGDDLKIVNGKISAEQYAMMPNSRAILLDSSMDRFYLKETDAAGVSKIRTYDFTEVIEEPVSQNYITLEQLEEVLSRYEFTPKQPESKPNNQQPKSSQF